MDKAKDKAQYFLKRAKETSSLETKLVLLNNAYNCFDALKPAYTVVSIEKEQFKAIINACINDSDSDVQCSLSQYNIEAMCKTLQSEVEKSLDPVSQNSSIC